MINATVTVYMPDLVPMIHVNEIKNLKKRIDPERLSRRISRAGFSTGPDPANVGSLYSRTLAKSPACDQLSTVLVDRRELVNNWALTPRRISGHFTQTEPVVIQSHL
ncbi:hypothetical protein CROQUDRAFT_97183 [Cronartium quercuum f. sp. fusiforme G11]|uniref:Uncharacterized protein n=1 Tax=Cronartium quercuum f. sp. fusiforme G11 TaxID=708437 RepID=A0A9P6T8N1_9BASI|nr:hypothetical protein CROQUDRAFT_97183 [Cronartium quercuum f. sp. fusiforme G11]